MLGVKILTQNVLGINPAASWVFRYPRQPEGGGVVGSDPLLSREPLVVARRGRQRWKELYETVSNLKLSLSMDKNGDFDIVNSITIIKNDKFEKKLSSIIIELSIIDEIYRSAHH